MVNDDLPIAMVTSEGDEWLVPMNVDREIDAIQERLDEFNRLLDLAEERHREWREANPV